MYLLNFALLNRHFRPARTIAQHFARTRRAGNDPRNGGHFGRHERAARASYVSQFGAGRLWMDGRFAHSRYNRARSDARVFQPLRLHAPGNRKLKSAQTR